MRRVRERRPHGAPAGTPGVWLAAFTVLVPLLFPSAVHASPVDYAGARAAGSDSAAGSADLYYSGAASGPIDPKTYRIGPGDLLQLNYSGRVSRAVLLPVGPEGSTFIPGWGLLQVGGLTLEQARRLVDRNVATQLRGVQLDLTLVRVRTLRVHLTGEVRSPGPIEILATSRVSDALPDSQLTANASRRNVELRHSDGTVQISDLGRFNLTGNAIDDPGMRDGDVLFVPAAARFVEVLGAVARPGRFELGPHDSLRTLLEMAGGPLPYARPDYALHVHWTSPTRTESLFCRLDDITSGAHDPPVQDGERLYVYFVSNFHQLEQAAIYGEVKTPGSYPLVTGQTRLSDLVRAAGGLTERADPSTIHLYRPNPGTQEADPELERLLRLSRSEMTAVEYDMLRARLAEKRGDYRVDFAQLQRSPRLDVVLIAGDVVQVDLVKATVRVEGEVRHPGLVGFDPRLGARGYVDLAGGFSGRAATHKVLVTRRLTGQTIRASDVDKVSPGDMIWVPERQDVTFWQGLQALITVAAQVATIVIAARAVR